MVKDAVFQKSALSVALLAAAVSLPSTASYAQELEEVIVVSSLRQALQRGVDVKRDAGGVVDSISSEGIGKFPDNNLAESLQRISGVSIDRSGGEGQSITVRGFGPQFNTVLLNGRQLATETDTRAFSFDTIASEMVSGIDVYKTANAATQSGGVGSTINLRTLRPFDKAGLTIAGSIKGQYESNSETTNPQISGVISNTFADDTVGVLVAISKQERDVKLNWAQTNGWLENVGVPQSEINNGVGWNGNIFTPRNFDLLISEQKRERTNGNLVLQFRPSDSLELTIDYLTSTFDIEDNTTSYGHWFTGSNLEDVILDENGTAVDLYQEVGLATDFHAKSFDRETETDSFSANLEWSLSENLTMNIDIHTSSAERSEGPSGAQDQLSLLGYANRVRFQSDGALLPWASEFQAANPSIYSGQQEIDGVAYNPAITPDGVSDYLDTDNLRAHVMLRRGWQVEDDVNQFKWDTQWQSDDEQGLISAKAGIHLSNEEKALTRWDNEGVGIHCTYCGYPDVPAVSIDTYIVDGGSDFLSGVSGSGRTPAVWIGHNAEAQFAALEAASGVSFDAVVRDNSFTVEEETLSLYAEFDFAGELAGMPISMTTGARYETTDVSVSGTEAPLTGLTILDATELQSSFGNAQPISSDSDYNVLLPSLSVKLDITEELVGRFAASRTLTRPTLRDMAPVTVITTTRQGGNLTSTSGNSELNPFFSNNIDLSLEYYYGDSSYASLGYFRKDVDNFIVTSTESITFTDPSNGQVVTDPSANDAPAVFTNTLPSNGETASVDGFEFVMQHAFGESGFGIQFNATVVDSNATLDPADINQIFALTGLSDSYNIVTYYENERLQARLAYNYRDQFLKSLTQVNGDGVINVDEYSQLDFSTSFDLTDNITVFFEGINLTEEYVSERGRFSNHFLKAVDSGRRFALGLRASF